MKVLAVAFVAACCLSLAAPVHAVPILWTISGASFDDGGTLTGSFVYDADTDTYSSISITTTSGTEFGGASYSDANFDVGGSTTLDLDSDDWPNAVDESSLSLVFFDFLTNAGGAVAFEVDGFTVEVWCINVPDCLGAGDRGQRDLVSGTVTGTAVPLPAPIWMLAPAGALLAWRRRSRTA